MKKIKATCQVLAYPSEFVVSERIIGHYDTVDEASFAAHAERMEGECVAIYGAPVDEEEDMSALDMAENEIMWNETTREYFKF